MNRPQKRNSGVSFNKFDSGKLECEQVYTIHGELECEQVYTIHGELECVLVYTIHGELR